MLDLLLIASLGFLGSFGHCVGMCGPITVAFSLSQPTDSQPTWRRQLYFHGIFNLGRILSYALVGAAIGALGSVVIASGQMAGVGSGLRRGIALAAGSLLVWFGLCQVSPGLMPKIPLLHPMARGNLHDRLNRAMAKFSLNPRWWTPALLGMVWGLIPCGFLYAAQIKAAGSSSLWGGAATMLAFGLGTSPTMLGVGVYTSLLSQDRRSQLFRLGGWVTILIGVLMLMRTGDTMVDYTGYSAIVCLILALIARPISRLWPHPLRFRRVLGVGAFILSLVHTAHMIEHSWGWNFNAFYFMLPQHQLGIIAGVASLALMMPLAFTSFDWAQKQLGRRWRSLHLLSIPALALAANHSILLGSRDLLGGGQLGWIHHVQAILLTFGVVSVLLLRSRWVWSILSLERFYVPPTKS